MILDFFLEFLARSSAGGNDGGLVFATDQRDNSGSLTLFALIIIVLVW